MIKDKIVKPHYVKPQLSAFCNVCQVLCVSPPFGDFDYCEDDPFK